MRYFLHVRKRLVLGDSVFDLNNIHIYNVGAVRRRAVVDGRAEKLFAYGKAAALYALQQTLKLMCIL